MKALTILQPYPWMIFNPTDDSIGHVQKRVENRSRNMNYRGPLLIHAGKSRRMMDDYPWSKGISFGSIIGVVEVIECLRWETGNIWTYPRPKGFHWMTDHPHAHGPYAIVLENPRQFAEPIPYKGKQGLFNVPDEVIAEQMKGLVE